MDITENKEIQTIKSDNQITAGNGLSIEVNTEAQAVKASEYVKGINDRIKLIEEKRLTFTKPLNESLTAINATFKELSVPLNEVKIIVTNRIMSWRRSEQEKAEKEEARRRAIQEAHRDQGHQVNAPVVMEKQKAVVGNISVRKIWKYRIEDFSKLSDKFKEINQTEINNSIRAGVREIAGLKIYQEEISTIR